MLLRIEKLQVSISLKGIFYKAVEDLSLSLEKQKTLCLVGESGCGKSITALALLNLLPTNARIDDGSIDLEDIDLGKLSSSEWSNIRGKAISMIFQEPGTSLNPLLTVGYQLQEVLSLHQRVGKVQAKEKVLTIMREVGLSSVEQQYHRYPHELSGGMKQRIMIAMALLCEPKVLIADEPTTALDATIQAQILELIRALQKKHHTALLLISHDLGIVAEMADDVAVMYAGMIVEMGTVRDIFENQKHPYTKALHEALEMKVIPGRVPTLPEFADHCRFFDRCPSATAICKESMPPLEKKSETHFVRCFHA